MKIKYKIIGIIQKSTKDSYNDYCHYQSDDAEFNNDVIRVAKGFINDILGEQDEN